GLQAEPRVEGVTLSNPVDSSWETSAEKSRCNARFRDKVVVRLVLCHSEVYHIGIRSITRLRNFSVAESIYRSDINICIMPAGTHSDMPPNSSWKTTLEGACSHRKICLPPCGVLLS
ncbi:unnamed protein product, partial [Discosporangium mesarthrocarpum]